MYRHQFIQHNIYRRSLILGFLLLGGSSLVSLPTLAASPLSCNNIYAITSDTNNTLLQTFDPTNGTTTTVATMGAAANAFTLGIDPIGGRAYYVANAGAAPFHVFSYNPISGVTTDTGTVIPIPSGSAALWLGFDQTGVGYVVDVNFNAWSFTPGSAVVTSLGVIGGMAGYNGGDISFDSNNVGWTVSRNTTTGNYALFRVTKSGNTLTATKVNDLKEGGVTVSNAANIGSIAFDPAGNLYIVRSSDGHSWKIDPKTAIATTIANSIANNGNGLSDFASCAIPTIVINPITVSGNVFHDQDADLAINGTDAGTNAGSSTLTIYAVDSAGKVINKALVNASGAYSLTNIPQNSSIKLRLSNDNTVAIGGIAPTTPSIPSGWYHTGENLNGTIDPVIDTLGDIALTTTTVNLTNENFGIRQGTTTVADPVPTVCSVDYRTTLNTGITAAGGQLAVGANDLNWTAEWIDGPAGTHPNPFGTPYAPPRPVGPMPAVVVGNLVPGFWINEPANARWISYPFRLLKNGNGDHRDADLDNKTGEDGSQNPITGTSDTVRLKFTAKVTLPSNASTISISLPIGAAMDNQFFSIKVNGVENLSPVPTPNPQANNYGAFTNVNLTKGWQVGVNTIEVVLDSGQPQAGFLLAVNAATTQVCGKANFVSIKRITAINGVNTINPSDNTTRLNQVLNNPATPNDDPGVNWPPNYLVGAYNAGKIKPGDELEYTVYFLNANGANVNTIKICDRVIGNQTYKPGSLQLQLGNAASIPLTDAADPTIDRGQFYASSASAPAACNLITPAAGVADNGTWGVDVTGTGSTKQPNLTTMPSAISPGSPTNSYGFIRFKTIVNP